MSSPSRQKMLQHLDEAHALEATLATVLTSHIAVTPRGPYRALLERHRAETIAQRDRLQERLRELGVSRNPLAFAYGALQAVTGQALAIGKLPLDLLRGGSGEEKLLKNAKDEAASEALEIATYDALEALANALDDPKTATLAREHRTQEELFLRDLREQIPVLTGAVADAEVHGEPSYDPATTGAADAARRTAQEAGARVGQVAATAAGVADEAVGEVQDLAADAVEGARDLAQDAAGEIRETAGEVRETAGDAVQAVPGAREAAAEITGARDAVGDVPEDLPISGYDALTVEQVLPKLRTLSAEELAAIDGYERAGRSRKRILDRVAALRSKRVEEELAAL